MVSAAGVNLRPPMAELDEAVWDSTMRLNLDAPFLLGQRFGPGMAQRGYGRLIAICRSRRIARSSTAGRTASRRPALEGLARSQAEAWSARA